MTSRVSEILETAVREGFLTEAVAADGVRHSAGFLRPTGDQPPLDLGASDLVVDLGTGGGLPGIVLAARTNARWVLVERSDRRCRFLKWAVRTLDLEPRVGVVNADARDVARSDFRGQAALVTARAFGPPATTAEIGSALLRVGGLLVVSEPPSGGGSDPLERWPSVGLARVGLADSGTWQSEIYGYRGFLCISTTPDRFPRRGPAMADDPVF